ncbi:hypothetical protein QM565_05480 [Geitlerinema splendidum]|nr:hypothetical protein [Geitlerinema splendidum]
MSDSESSKLMKSLLGKLYQVLTAGDGPAEASSDNFISWCVPGIPFKSEELLFASKATGASGDEERDLLLQASNFSRFVNFVPDVSGVYDTKKQETTYNQSGNLLWNIYSNVLQYSEISNAGELTDSQKQQLERWNGLLVETYEEEDIITGAKKQKTRPGSLVRAYKDKQQAYIQACLTYNSKRLAAMASETPEDVRDWRYNASLYRMSVQNAMDAWVSEGYKNEYEQITSAIDQITRRSLVLWKRKLDDNLDKSKQTDINGQNFYLTTFWPARFASATEGWTKFDFKQESVRAYSNYETNGWSVDVSATYGLFSGSLSNKGEISTTNDKLDVSNFSMSFEIIQVPILRPWFSPEFLTNAAWRFKSGLGMSELSSGGRPPKGSLPAYPTTAIFIRNLKADFGELHNEASTYKRDISTGVSVGYGPFRLSGSYRNAYGESKFNSEVNQEGLSANGLQLIAFKCAVLPKSPNPSSDIKSWI